MKVFEEFDNDTQEELDLTADQAFVKSLIEVALKNEHPPIELLKSTDEYYAAKALYKANIKISKAFKKETMRTYKEYCKELKETYTTTDTLIQYRTLLICADYYKQEADMIYDMIIEYLVYLARGHVMSDVVLGNQRKEEDLRDYRK